MATESTEPTQVAMATAPSVQTVDSRIDRVLANGVLRVGVDLTFPPLQFRDPDTNEPMGLMPEIDALMAQDLGVELEYVEMPFGELIAGLLADKFDWIGIAFTSTPERAKQVLFIDEPTFFEDSVLLLRKGFSFDKLSDLDSPEVTFSNMSGSAQDASARLLFPNAAFKPLGWPETVLEVAAGRSDACLIAIWNAAAYINENPDTVDIWDGGSLFADVNTFFVPQGDYKTKEWIGNWFRYYGAHGWQQSRFNYWIGELPGVRAIQEAWE
jgi:polar amino acid transport system substrate-binding protein